MKIRGIKKLRLRNIGFNKKILLILFYTTKRTGIII